MPTPFEELTSRVREALRVDASYETTIIPYGIKRAAKRLLRDYHFPWSVQKKEYTAIAAGQQNYALPLGFKKELAVMFYDTEEKSWSEPLLKRSGFILPGEDGVPRYYWMWNGNISTDIKVENANTATTELVLWYESIDWATNETWLMENFEDMLFTLTTFRLATEYQKKELAEIYGVLWGDDRQSLAKYANELEFDNGIYMQREARSAPVSRYPR